MSPLVTEVRGYRLGGLRTRDILSRERRRDCAEAKPVRIITSSLIHWLLACLVSALRKRECGPPPASLLQAQRHLQEVTCLHSGDYCLVLALLLLAPRLFAPLACPIFIADNSYLSYGKRSFVLSTVLSLVLAHVPIANASEPNELLVIQNGVKSVLSKAKAAGILRLVFHDAGTFDLDSKSGGMNGSIIYELDRPENAGLSKSVKVLEKAKREIENIQKVSWADLIAVAGAEAVALCGGPTIPIRIGRVDSSIPDAPGKLPEETLDAIALKRCFQNKGFSTQELVVLSGAHTIGNKGFKNPFVFDNSYFKMLLEKPWTSASGMSNMIGLPSDRALVEDDECLRWINTYAGDQLKFFDDFKDAYIKLVNTGASWQSS